MKKYLSIIIFFLILLSSVFQISIVANTFSQYSTTENESLEMKMKKYQAQMAKPGKYKVVLFFEKHGVSLEKIIFIDVKDDVLNNVYSVFSDDISLTASEARNLSVNDWIKKANIKIVNESLNQVEVITYVDTSFVEDEIGKYEVFFGNENVGASFILTIISSSNNILNEPTIENQEKINENSALNNYEKNNIYGFSDSELQNLNQEEIFSIFFLSSFMLIFFVLALLFLLFQYILSDNMLRKVSSFFEKSK